MKRIPAAAALAAATALLAATLAPTATAAPQSTAAACGLRIASVTTGGDLRVQQITASPPKVTRTFDGPKDLYPAADWRLLSSISTEPDIAGEDRYGYVTIDNSLYRYSYQTDGGYADVDPGSYEQTKIGGGWTRGMTYFDTSTQYNSGGTKVRWNAYSLWDGTLWRWNNGWTGVKLFGGFGAVKAMTLISQTATYDSFLATTQGGALYTIRIPVGSGAVPVVKPVRTRTWQGFETLIAEKCGSQSTLLLGIDKDTNSAYLYAVSHANGTATVIQGLGKVSGGTFTDVIYSRAWANSLDAVSNLNGE